MNFRDLDKLSNNKNHLKTGDALFKEDKALNWRMMGLT
jgi:hypothetical protein